MSSSVLKNVIHPTQPLSAAASPDEGGLSPWNEGPPGELELVLGVLVENAPVGMAMFDHQMRYMLANRQWITEFGLQGITLTGKSQYEVFPGLHPGWRQVYDRALQGHIVRSEHDALAGPDGRRIIYQWEVRPWRRQKDASVGGVMVTCERFTTTLPSATDETEDAPDTESAATPTEPDLFDQDTPVVVLDAQGTLLRASTAACNACLARGIREGVSSFWDAFGDGRDAANVKKQVLQALQDLSQPEAPTSKIIELRSLASSEDPESSTPLGTHWLFSRLRSPQEGVARFSALALPVTFEAPQPAPPLPVAPAAPPAVAHLPSLAQAVAAVSAKPAVPDQSSALEIRRLQDDLARARQELRTLHEASQSFSRRENRQRAIMDALPFGVLVLDEYGAPLFQNDQLNRLLGKAFQKEETVEQWLAAACPDAQHREEVITTWRESIWRRQLTKTISLATADGLLKELEFKPVSLPGGGLLISIQDATELCRHEEQLRALEAKFRVLLQQNPVGVVLMDKGGAIYEVNHQAEELLGHSKAELRRYPLDAWLEPESASARREALRQMRDEGRRDTELPVRIRQSTIESVSAQLHIADVADAEGEPHCTIHFFEPVPVPSQSEESSNKSEHAQAASSEEGNSGAPTSGRRKVASAPVLLLKTNVNGRISAWSAQAGLLLNRSEEEARNTPLHTYFRPSDPSGFFAQLTEQSQTPKTAFELRCFPKDRAPFAHQFTVRHRGQGMMDFELWDADVSIEEDDATAVGEVSALQSGSASSAVDPSLLSPGLTPAQRWPMADLDREKLLLSETHHRIKNHLQIISSLLNLELNTVNEQNARMALRSSQNRVRSIAALHQHLYEMAQGSEKSFGDFAQELVTHLRSCYDTPEERIRVHLNIEEGLIQQEWLMPLALTLNETLSNSLEHGFPDGGAGEIQVRLRLNDTEGEVVIQDNGVGLPEGFVAGDSAGLGLKILAVFAEQMRGQLHLLQSEPQGTEIRLRFPIASADI